MTERAGGTSWWYLSFAGEDCFLGACIVGPCEDFLEAVQKAHVAGCNPGGEVCGWEMSPQMAEDTPERFKHRLLNLGALSEMSEAMGFEGTVLNLRGEEVGVQ